MVWKLVWASTVTNASAACAATGTGVGPKDAAKADSIMTSARRDLTTKSPKPFGLFI